MLGEIVHIREFLSLGEISSLRDLFLNSNDKLQKPTGPITLDISRTKDDVQIRNLLQKIRGPMGSFEVVGGNFYLTENPYIVHCDNIPDLHGAPSVNLVLPLSEEFSTSERRDHFIVLFEQRFFGSARKFFFDDAGILAGLYPHQYHRQGVVNLVGGSPEANNPLLSHLKSMWLNGLSVAEKLSWQPGSLIAFDGSHLHCSSNFRAIGLVRKLGLALFIHPQRAGVTSHRLRT